MLSALQVARANSLYSAARFLSQPSHTPLLKTCRIPVNHGPSIRDILNKSIGDKVHVQGWIRTARIGKHVAFLEVHDGSNTEGIQIVMGPDDANHLHAGCSIDVYGELVNSFGKEQSTEVQATQVSLLGDARNYPLQKKYHSMEYLRQIGHLRPRTKSLNCVLRLRHQLQRALLTFLNNLDFLQVQTPILTSNDCEGGGETFSISSRKKKDFFDRNVYLTVSGQLHLEMIAASVSKAYTFGPTFRAENSNTSRHLSEFWMLEAEISFLSRLEDLISYVENLVLYSIDSVLSLCPEELSYFESLKPGHVQRLKNIASLSRFPRVEYIDACKLLNLSESDITTRGLSSEDEKKLCSIMGNIPVCVVNYPASIKPFYMRKNDHSSGIETVAAMDLLMPDLGEVVGGSLREERYPILSEQLTKKYGTVGDLDWYLELRKYGTVPHGGFGLGFERWVQFITGLDNIRDTTAFIRTPGHCPY